MDISTLLELYGLPGLIIGGLTFAWRMERSDRKELQDKRDKDHMHRLDREREHSKELAETVQAIRDMRRGEPIK